MACVQSHIGDLHGNLGCKVYRCVVFFFAGLYLCAVENLWFWGCNYEEVQVAFWVMESTHEHNREREGERFNYLVRELKCYNRRLFWRLMEVNSNLPMILGPDLQFGELSLILIIT